MLLDKDLNVIDEVDPRVSQAFEKPTLDVLKASNDSEPQVGMFPNYVAAVIKLRGYSDIYLYIARVLDSRACSRNCRRRRPG